MDDVRGRYTGGRKRPYRRCCGTDKTFVGPPERLPRGAPGRRKMLISRKVFHERMGENGVEHFWHWEDQRGRLVERKDPEFVKRITRRGRR